MLAETTTSWYEQGNWPLVGAILVLVVTNAFALWKIWVQANANLKIQLRLKRIDFTSEQLSHFYNPLVTLLTLNKELFEKLGPQSFPNGEVHRNAAAQNWEKIKENGIIPNNKEVKNLLTSRLHLLSTEDSASEYKSLYNHISMYEIFQENPTEIYNEFRFPPKVLDHVSGIRDSLTEQLNKLKLDEQK